jgi:SAM-dependent methyltransferase
MKGQRWLSDAHARLHEKWVFDRRSRVLIDAVAALLPESGDVLDVGCGSGAIGAGIAALKPGLSVRGVDTLARPGCAIPVQAYDGARLPLSNASVDFCLLIDVLHHAEDPQAVLKECVRVSRRGVIVKDHFQNGLLSRAVLSFMDWVGNGPHGVALPRNYWPEHRWLSAWRELNIQPDVYRRHLGLYPKLFQPLFERNLHFLARLVPSAHR